MSSIKDKDTIVGSQTRVKVVKNKVAPPFKQAEFDIIYNEGISKLGEILDMGVRYGFIEKAGSYYSSGGTKLGQGRENSKMFLKNNPELVASLEEQIRQHLQELMSNNDLFAASKPNAEDIFEGVEEVF